MCRISFKARVQNRQKAEEGVSGTQLIVTERIFFWGGRRVGSELPIVQHASSIKTQSERRSSNINCLIFNAAASPVKSARAPRSTSAEKGDGFPGANALHMCWTEDLKAATRLRCLRGVEPHHLFETHPVRNSKPLLSACASLVQIYFWAIVILQM